MKEFVYNSLKVIFPKYFLKSWGWALLAFFLLILIFCIKFKCFNCERICIINRVILNLSYSYVAAAIFHLIVNVLPSRKRKNVIKPFLESKLWSIKENLRLCKQTILPFYVLANREYSKAEYKKIFSETNLYEDSLWGKGHSKLVYLENLRSKIIDDANLILAYREYINDDIFIFLNEIINSEFIKKGIRPYPDIKGIDRNNYESNQSNIGENIYDLYEKIRLTIK